MSTLPDATVYVPPLKLLDLRNRSVPTSTWTVPPLLVNGTYTELVRPPPDFLNVPVLVNAGTAPVPRLIPPSAVRS